LFFGIHYAHGVSILVAIFLLFLRFFIPFGEISIFLKPPLQAVSVQRLASMRCFLFCRKASDSGAAKQKMWRKPGTAEQAVEHCTGC